MNISTETREILRNYKAVINARRREMGQKPLTTAQIVDEICDFVANQQEAVNGPPSERSTAGRTPCEVDGRRSFRSSEGAHERPVSGIRFISHLSVRRFL
ncbi:hypothetical protein [Escherichia coli]|uniref:hypothetical protein n=1 Tax=Escherichia coli TaxID=562 RepID=UPI002044D558|nr:hypothetical protein [Escherichia coli]